MGIDVISAFSCHFISAPWTLVFMDIKGTKHVSTVGIGTLREFASLVVDSFLRRKGVEHGSHEHGGNSSNSKEHKIRTITNKWYWISIIIIKLVVMV